MYTASSLSLQKLIICMHFSSQPPSSYLYFPLLHIKHQPFFKLQRYPTPLPPPPPLPSPPTTDFSVPRPDECHGLPPPMFFPGTKYQSSSTTNDGLLPPPPSRLPPPTPMVGHCRFQIQPSCSRAVATPNNVGSPSIVAKPPVWDQKN